MESDLIEFGLNPTQAKLYLVLLRSGEVSASEAARQADVPRLTAYSVLEKLTSMQLVISYEKRRHRVYKANPPESLLDCCDREILQIQKKRRQLGRLLPSLRACLKEAGAQVPMGRSIVSIEDSYLFERRLIRALEFKPVWWVIDDEGVPPFLEDFGSKSETAPRFLLPYSKRSKIASTSSDFVRFLSDAHFKGATNCMLAGHSFFVFPRKRSPFSVIEVYDAGVSRMLENLFWLLWQSAWQSED